MNIFYILDLFLYFEKQKEMVDVLIGKLHELLKSAKKYISKFYTLEEFMSTSMSDEETRIGTNRIGLVHTSGFSFKTTLTGK